MESRIFADVVVVGSGAGGLASALAAADAGASVVMLESSDRVGGTTAYSGGMAWVPCSAHFAEVSGSDDSAEAASRYIRDLVQDRSYDDSLIDVFVEQAPRAIDFLESRSPLRMRASQTYTDYFADRSGGTAGGRSLIPEPFEASGSLGDWLASLQESPHFPVPLTLDEMVGKAGADPRNADRATMVSSDLKQITQERLDNGVVTSGRALVGALLAGALALGVDVRTGWRMQRLTTDGDVVSGVVAVRDGEICQVVAARGVVLASGGFESNPDLVLAHLGTTGTKALGVPTNVGDGLIAGVRAGAATANMTSGWNYPVTVDPTRVYAGAPLASIQSTRFEPGSIAVDATGRRFVNEGASYVDVGKAFLRYDEVTQTYPGRTAWLVFDQSVRDRAIVADLRPGDPTPRWVVSADTLPGLAAELEIEPEALETTIRDFNADVSSGLDRAFGRGSVWFEGQTRGGPNAADALAPIQRPPFYAMPFRHGLLGTAGGLRIDAHGQVLSAAGAAIGGLYACGNVAASPFGPMYPGGGTTLGLALTFGFLAGRRASRS